MERIKAATLFPEIELYHYTTHAGYLGLRESGRLWLTNIAYQNDKNEYNYAKEVILKTIGHYPCCENLEGKFMDGFDVPPVYTFSLSEESNMLSQWRGYCPNGGVSISFNTEILNEAMKSNGLTIGKCKYDIKEQEIFIKQCLVGQIDDPAAIEKEMQNLKNRYNSEHDLYYQLMQFVPFIKNDDFKEEKEWRIVKSFELGFRGEIQERIKLRATGDKILPYIEIPLKKENGNLIKHLIVGPSVNSSHNLQAYKLPNDVDHVDVSGIPYKNW